MFSVATPTLNSLDKLKRCVGSVRGQTGVTIEHLVQDACSTDGTVAWLSAQTDLAASSERDAGMYDAIERAWRRSQGRVLSWLNSDEQYLPGALKVVADFLEARPDVDVVFGDYIVCRSDGAPVALRREIPFRSLYVRNSFLNSASCTLFFRRALLESGQLRFDTSLRYAADKDLLLRLAAQGARIAHVPRYLALFGLDGSNLSTHPGMLSEAESVRQRHGAFRSLALRRSMLMARRVERLLRGAYFPRATGYDFATDECPHYVRITARHAGGRYDLSDGVSR
jgi:glycosyltransferase involved in cell wall biosynthesis